MSKICQPKELFKIKPIVIWSEGMYSRTKHLEHKKFETNYLMMPGLLACTLDRVL